MRINTNFQRQWQALAYHLKASQGQGRNSNAIGQKSAVYNSCRPSEIQKIKRETLKYITDSHYCRVSKIAHNIIRNIGIK